MFSFDELEISFLRLDFAVTGICIMIHAEAISDM